jgi:hypothetical protein
MVDGGCGGPFISVFVNLLGNRQIEADPGVKGFNNHEKFLTHVLGRACAEYVAEICETGTDYHFTPQLLAQADANYSFSLVVHFLYDFLFFYQEFRDNVRTNNSTGLDRGWREFLAIGKTELGHKTNYTQMAVAQVYWGIAMIQPLRSIYANLRTLRLVKTHVGWDMFVERINALIKQGCLTNITRESICDFLEHINFTDTVNRTFDEMVRGGRAQKTYDKKVDADVAKIKEKLRSCIGTTYAQATAASTDNSLNLDLSQWGGGIARRHMTHRPWTKMQDGMRTYREYVEAQLAKLCHWHQWQ